MGLPGWRRATTTPGTANATRASRTSHPSDTSPAGQARGMYRTVSANVAAPRATAVLAGADRTRRAAFAASSAWPTGSVSPTRQRYARIVPGTLPRRESPGWLSNWRPCDAHDGKEGGQAGVVIGVSGVERQSFGDRGRGDHQVGDSPPGGAASGDDSRGDTAEQAGCLGIERYGVELVLGALEDFQAPGSFGMLVVLVLLVVAADLVGPGGQFRERDGADRYLVGQLAGIDPRTQDQDVGVEHALPVTFTVHRGRPPDDPPRRPGQP